jgi:hypothetical protein
MRTAGKSRILLAAGVAATTIVATACGGGGSSGAGTGSASSTPTASQAAPSDTSSPTAAAASPAGVDPCSLLTDAEVATFAPGLKAHRVEHPVAKISICAWPDAKGIPDVMLQVYPATGPLAAELNTGLNATGGYSIATVSGIGDEAVTAYTKANSSLGIKGGQLAALEARSGDQVVMISVTYTSVTKGSTRLKALEKAMTTALTRLP